MARLPEKDEETKKFCKSYICNIVYTLVGDQFKLWVMGEIERRNTTIAEKQNLLVHMDPQIAKAFYKSTSVSTYVTSI